MAVVVHILIGTIPAVSGEVHLAVLCVGALDKLGCVVPSDVHDLLVKGESIHRLVVPSFPLRDDRRPFLTTTSSVLNCYRGC